MQSWQADDESLVYQTAPSVYTSEQILGSKCSPLQRIPRAPCALEDGFTQRNSRKLSDALNQKGEGRPGSISLYHDLPFL